MTGTVRVGLIGQKFMGRAHSNAFSQAAKFCQPPLKPVLAKVAARDAGELPEFATTFGWEAHTTRWRDLVEDPDIDLVDVATPNHVHAEQTLALLEAGKHVCCEKPLAGSLADARSMRDAAKKAKRQKTFVWFNYRRTPALATAYRLIQEGRIGRIFHVRASYLQDWGGPDTPFSWRFSKKLAGSGAHGDLNAHIIDMARFLVGEPITEIHGAVARTFIKERVDAATGAKKKCDVDDAVLFTASFKSGATASFEATRLAGPHQNDNNIEINGELGSLKFSFEDMNLLHFYDATEGPRTGGWRRIMCTSAGNHPYAENWWPDAHIIGYEHTFTNQVADVMAVLAGKQPAVPLPDFQDAYETQRVLEAALLAAKQRASVKLSEVK